MAGKKPLGPIQTKRVIAMYEAGEPLEVIARKYGRSVRGINHLLRREGVPTRTGHAEHGTTARAVKHYRDGEKPCSDCAAAWRAIQPVRAEMTEEEREAVRENHRRWYRKRAARKRRRRSKQAWVKRRDRARREAAIQASVPDALDRLGKSLGLKE